MSSTIWRTCTRLSRMVASRVGVRLWRRRSIVATDSVAVSVRSMTHEIWATVCVMAEAKAEAVVTDSVRTIHHRAEVSTLTPTVSAEVSRAQDLIREFDRPLSGRGVAPPFFN